MAKGLKKLSLSVVALLATAGIISGCSTLGNKAKQSEEKGTVTGTAKLKGIKNRVAVHDPSVVKDGDSYYVFGSHIDAAKTTDLINWTRFTNGYATPGNKIFGKLAENLSGSFAWAGNHDGDAKTGFSVWAPFVLWNPDYVNADGTKGAYLNYYCTSSTYKRSAIGFAVAKNIEGPYTYVDTLVYSGFTNKDNYDGKSSNGSITMNTAPTNYSNVNTNYTNTNIKSLIESGKMEGANPSWFSSNGAYSTAYAPNAIDPALFTDKDGRMWMVYGSWSGGIFMLEIDKATGKAIYPGKDGTTAGGNHIDRYFGEKIAVGYTKSGEGPFVVYDKESGYYYLYVTYGGLAANGGYNMRMFRATSPEGPYVDASGKNAALPDGNTDNANYGIKLMGNYKFSSLSVGYRSGGHNSSFIDSDGQMYLLYHTRFDNGTEGHQVRVHQMFKNEDGWPVVAPYEYNGDKISPTGYSLDEIVGTYEFINHGTSNSPTMVPTLKVTLNKDHTISGNAKGTWNMTEGTYYMSMEIKGITYKGVFFKQNDESKFDSKVMTFSAIGTNNQSIWGSKNVEDSQAVLFDSFDLNAKVTKSTTRDIKLPTQGANKTTITWTSSDTKVIDNNGKVTQADADKEVTLTAKIVKGKESAIKTFKVKVRGK